MPERRSFLGSVFSDPWRKLFSLALAVGLWTVIHRQLVDRATFGLDVLVTSELELPTEVLRHNRLFVIETEDWSLVEWNKAPFTGRKSIVLDIEAPNDVLASFRANPFGVAGPFDFEELAGDKTELELPIELSAGRSISFGRASSLRDASLRIDGADRIHLKFRKYRREVVRLTPGDLAYEGLDERVLEIDATKSRVEPERFAIRLPQDRACPPLRELFKPVQVTGFEESLVQLQRSDVWELTDLHFADSTAPVISLRLALASKAPSELPDPILITFNPTKKIQGYFLYVDAELPINPRDYVDFEPLQVDQAQLRWKRTPLPQDLDDILERSADLQRYVYFYADLSAMLDYDSVVTGPSEASRLPFLIRPQDQRARIEVKLRHDTPPDLLALMQWFEIEPAGATEVHCWRRP